MLTRPSKSTFALGVLALIGILAPAPAHAYFSTIDTGEVITPKTYQVGFEPQYITNRYEGVQGTARFDAGIDDESSARGLIGTGPVGFELGGFYKWIPFPDADGQPAIGGEVGAIVARVPGGNEVSLRFHPLISKRLETEVGDFIPYASLPLGLTVRPDRTVVPIQLEGGVEFRPLNMQNLSVFAELGIDMLDAFGYFSVAVAYRFDDAMIRHRPRRSR